MNKPSVSIIIPVYNVEAYVADCIKSVTRQTYRGELECILVDDCGSDKSMEIVEKMVSEYDGPVRFKILHRKQNGGVSAARNTGIKHATGDYLFFLDSDDEVTDDCIEELVRPLNDGPYDIVGGRRECLFLSTTSGRESYEDGLVMKIPGNTLLEQPDILRTFLKGWDWMIWNKLVRSDFIRENNLLFKEGVNQEDALWSFQMACLAKTMYFIPDITYRYKLRAGSTCDTMKREESIKLHGLVLKAARTFMDTRGIQSKDVFPFFNLLFYRILEYYSYSKTQFVSKYKEFRPYCCKPSFFLVKQDRKNLIRWTHYWMPGFIAPYWQWHFFKARHTFTETVPENN
jgi:glycosyltransferase involved in cell wall biosynthesis